MLTEIVVSILCLWAATKFRRKLDRSTQGKNAWDEAKVALRRGIMIVTIPMLGYFGIVRYLNGLGYPCIFTLILCTGLTAIVLMGAEMEITGNVIFDSILLALFLVCACFTIVNGFPEALARTSGENLCRWFLMCVLAAIFIRAFTWALKGK